MFLCSAPASVYEHVLTRFAGLLVVLTSQHHSRPSMSSLYDQCLSVAETSLLTLAKSFGKVQNWDPFDRVCTNSVHYDSLSCISLHLHPYR